MNKKHHKQSSDISLHTIGFTQKTAQEFFTLLAQSGVKRIIDTRLNNVSQLAGFAKRKDLEYFLKVIANIEYVHILDLAPTQDILDRYKKEKGDWGTYEKSFLDLMQTRQIEKTISPKLLDKSCLLCSEAKPHNCHRRLVAEYLNNKLGNINICHL
jgi:uncharacterized protein (DUF488 family)